VNVVEGKHWWTPRTLLEKFGLRWRTEEFDEVTITEVMGSFSNRLSGNVRGQRLRRLATGEPAFPIEPWWANGHRRGRSGRYFRDGQYE